MDTDLKHYLIESSVCEIDYCASMDYQLMEAYLQEAIINKNKLINSYKKNFEVAKQYLSDHSVSVDFLKREAHRAAKLVNDGYKKNRKPADVAQDIVKKIGKNIFNKITKGSTGNKERKVEATLGSQIVGSLIIVSILVFVGFFVDKFFSIAFFQQSQKMKNIALFISGVLIAPLMEEIGKKIAVAEGYGFLFSGIFAALENIFYVYTMILKGLNVPMIVIIRTIDLIVHFLNTNIQEHYTKEKHSMTGYGIAVAVNILWSMLAFSPVLFK